MFFKESICVYMPSFRSDSPYFLAKVSFSAFFVIQKGMWTYTYAHNITLVTLLVCGSNFNLSSVNREYTDRQKDGQTIHTL